MGFFNQILRFRLIDTEGVLLSVGGFLEVREPEDIGKTITTLRRDTDTHGVYFEFTSASTPFIFDQVKQSGETFSGYDLVKEIKFQKGVDGKCQFQIESFNGVTWDELYLSDLDFGEYKAIDYAIEILGRRVTLGDTFRTRKDIPIDFTDTTSIDGTTVTGLTPSTMHLHSKVLQQVQNSNCRRLDAGGDLTTTEDYFLQWGIRDETGVTDYLETLEDEYGQEVKTVLYESLSALPSNYIFESKEGELVFDIDADYDIIAEDMDTETLTLSGLFVEVDGVEAEIGAVSDTFLVSGALDTKTITYTVDATISIPIDANVKIYEKWNLPDTGSAHGVNIIPNTANLFNITFNDIADNSEANVYKLKEALNHVSEVITNTTSVVVSDFFDTYGGQIYVNNGYLIRSFALTNKPPRFSFNDLFGGVSNPVLGLGFSLLDDSGTHKCVIERYEYFYQDTEIFYIEDIYNGTYERTTDKQIIFNQINSGYSIYPSSTDSKKSNNIDEFNTVNTHLTPIERYKQSVGYISTGIGSGYKLENQRRQQFSSKPKETVADDEKLFILTGINSDTYTINRITGEPINIIFVAATNLIKLYGTYFDIEVETITLAGSGMTNAGSFTVTGVERDGSYLVLTVTSVTSDEDFSDDYTLTLASTKLRAARNDEFETVDNVVSPKTIYNGGINPKYMLFNHSPIFNSGFNPKPDTDEIKTQEAKLNEDAQFRFASGEGGYILDSERTTVTMGGDLPLSAINGNTKLFEGNIFSFDAQLSYTNWLLIKASLTDFNDANLHGYLRFRAPDGNDYKGFPLEVSYELLSEKATFVLREKFEQRFDDFLLLENGDFLLLETGDKIIIE